MIKTNMLGDFTYLILVLGLIQGIVVGIILLLTQKNKAQKYLGIYVGLVGLQFAYYLFNYLSVTNDYPELLLLPLDSIWLRAALLYRYAEKVSIFPDEKKGKRFLIPGIIAFIIQFIVFWLPLDMKMVIKDSLYFNLFFGLGTLYNFSIAIFLVILIYRHFKEVKNQYSNTENKQLKWLWHYVLFSLGPLIVLILSYLIHFDYDYYKVMGITAIFLTYWVSIHGMMQIPIKSLVNKSGYTTAYEEQQYLSQPTIPLEERLQVIAKQIDTLLESKELYTKEDLNISDVASALCLHPKDISKAINSIKHKNFNAYINEYRIKKAIALIVDPQYHIWKMEGISKEVGFKSKSSFYTSFRKIMGCTPSKYLQQSQEKRAS